MSILRAFAASLFCAALWPGFALAELGPARPAAAHPPVATLIAGGAAVETHGARTSLTLALSAPVSATSFLLEAPDRVVIELPECDLAVGEAHGGLIGSLRGGRVAPGRSRLVVELTAPATVSRLDVVGDLGGAILFLDLAVADRDGFRRQAGLDRADLALTTGSLRDGSLRDKGLRDGGMRDGRPLIAIDAGHGGTDPGATAPSGIQEKDLTLAFATALAERLAGGGRYRILLVRDRDVFVPLDERVRRARDAGADLFLSVHADWINVRSVSGATIYTGGDRASDRESADLAARENAADGSGGPPLPALAPEVADILQDLRTRETRAVSAGFSRLLLRDLGPAVRLTPHPHREAGFRVLRSHDLPAVLIELGYMSNPRDLALMQAQDWRRRTAEVMAGSIDRFFAGRTPARAAMSP